MKRYDQQDEEVKEAITHSCGSWNKKPNWVSQIINTPKPNGDNHITEI